MTSKGPPALVVNILNSHSPLLLALIDLDSPQLPVTLTFSLGLALPQKVTFLFKN